MSGVKTGPQTVHSRRILEVKQVPKVMVVDKDVGKCWVSGNWENSKQSGYIHLLYSSSDGRLKAEGTCARLTNFLCTGAGLDVVC